MYIAIEYKREQLRCERPEAYAEVACEEIDVLESDALEVAAAHEAFTKGKEEGEKDNALFAFDERWGSDFDQGPIGKVLFAMIELKDMAEEAATFVAAQTVHTPSSHTANAIQYIQQGTEHLKSYRDSKLS